MLNASAPNPIEAATWRDENADAGLTPEARRVLAEWALGLVEADGSALEPAELVVA